MNSNSNWAFQDFQFQLKIMSQKLIIDFENSNSTRATNNYLLIPRFPIPTSNRSKVIYFSEDFQIPTSKLTFQN